MKYYFKIVWISLLLCSYLAFSYYYFNGWWYSSIGTGLILVFSYLIWGKEFLKVVGLKLSVKTILKTILLAICTLVCSFLLIKYIGSRNDISILFTSLGNYYHDVFYILNEEIILGGIPIFLLVSKLKINPIKVSIGLALIFAIVHFAFYKWVFIDRGIIEFQTLFTLFLVGIVRNNLIIVNKHIGYSWALHFGWMVILFGFLPIWVETDTVVTEPERFNIFLGSTEMLIISIVLASISLMHLVRSQRPKKSKTGASN
jgi:hypothetical protein